MACETCNPQYNWLPWSGDACYRTIVTPAVPPQFPVGLVNVISNEFNQFGTRFFAPGYTSDGQGQVVTTSRTIPVWYGTAGTFGVHLYVGNRPNGGPMNRSALWANQFTYNPVPVGSISTAYPLKVWLGFSECFETQESKTYYIGLAGDNNIRITLDGVEIVNTLFGPDMDSNILFKWWNVYPVFIPSGKHVIQVFGENNSQIAGFGCEIYNNTLNELTGATSLDDIDIIFTTSGQTTATLIQDLNFNQSLSGYTCPEGYIYGCNECIKYEFCNLYNYPPQPSCSAITVTQNNTTFTNVLPSGIYNNKPYYVFGNTPNSQRSIFWETSRNQWTCANGSNPSSFQVRISTLRSNINSNYWLPLPAANNAWVNLQISVYGTTNTTSGTCGSQTTTPTPTPTKTPTRTPTPTGLPITTQTPTPTKTGTPNATPTKTKTPTPTKTKTPLPICDCYTYNVTITANDIALASGNTQHPNGVVTLFDVVTCSGTSCGIDYTVPGTYQICIPSLNPSLGFFHIYQNNQTYTLPLTSTITNTFVCCTPSPSPTPTQTPTKTRQPLQPFVSGFIDCCTNQFFTVNSIPTMNVPVAGNTYYVQAVGYRGCAICVNDIGEGLTYVYQSLTLQSDCNKCLLNHPCPSATPTSTPTNTPTPTKTRTPTPTPTNTPTITRTPASTVAPGTSPTPTPSPTGVCLYFNVVNESFFGQITKVSVSLIGTVNGRNSYGFVLVNNTYTISWNSSLTRWEWFYINPNTGLPTLNYYLASDVEIPISRFGWIPVVVFEESSWTEPCTATTPTPTPTPTVTPTSVCTYFNVTYNNSIYPVTFAGIINGRNAYNFYLSNPLAIFTIKWNPSLTRWEMYQPNILAPIEYLPIDTELPISRTGWVFNVFYDGMLYIGTDVCNPSLCSMIIAQGTQDFVYNPLNQSSTSISVPSSVYALDVAHTSNKLWHHYQSGTSYKIREWNLTGVPPYTVSSNYRDLIFPPEIQNTSNPSLCAISDNKLSYIASVYNPSLRSYKCYAWELTIPSAPATQMTATLLFELPGLNRQLGTTGDHLITTDNKIICLATYQIKQYNYSNGQLEVTINLSSQYSSLAGIAQYNGEIYIVGSSLYKIDRNPPYTISYVSNFGGTGASQLPSCNTSSFSFVAVTPTSTPTTTKTPTVTPTNTKTPATTPTNTRTPSGTPTNTPTPSITPSVSSTPNIGCAPIYSFNFVVSGTNYYTFQECCGTVRGPYLVTNTNTVVNYEWCVKIGSISASSAIENVVYSATCTQLCPTPTTTRTPTTTSTPSPTVTPTNTETPTLTPTSTPTTTPTSTPTPTVTPSSSNTPQCSCPEGYVSVIDNSQCVKVLTYSATTLPNLIPYNALGSDSYGYYGYLVYGLNNYDIQGNSINGQYDYFGGTPQVGGNYSPQGFWVNRLNQIGLWVKDSQRWPGPVYPYPGTVYFCETVVVPQTKVYYFGVAGDNNITVKVNGNTIVSQFASISNENPQNFRYFHIYPITLTAGSNLISLECTNITLIGVFGAEIYDNTLTQITGTTSEGDLNILFSTKDYRTGGPKFGESFCNNKACPSGYTYNSDTDICEKLSYTCCGSQFYNLSNINVDSVNVPYYNCGQLTATTILGSSVDCILSDNLILPLPSGVSVVSNTPCPIPTPIFNPPAPQPLFALNAVIAVYFGFPNTAQGACSTNLNFAQPYLFTASTISLGDTISDPTTSFTNSWQNYWMTENGFWFRVGNNVYFATAQGVITQTQSCP